MRIKSFRESLSMTQIQLAFVVGVSRSSVAMWETGKSTPSIENLKKLSDIFGCTIDELVKGEQ